MCLDVPKLAYMSTSPQEIFMLLALHLPDCLRSPLSRLLQLSRAEPQPAPEHLKKLPSCPHLSQLVHEKLEVMCDLSYCTQTGGMLLEITSFLQTCLLVLHWQSAQADYVAVISYLKTTASFAGL